MRATISIGMPRYFVFIPCAFLIAACVLGQDRTDKSSSSATGALEDRIEQKVKEAMQANFGYGVLGEAMKRAANKSYDELLSEYILLTNSGIGRPIGPLGNWLMEEALKTFREKESDQLEIRIANRSRVEMENVLVQFPSQTRSFSVL